LNTFFAARAKAQTSAAAMEKKFPSTCFVLAAYDNYVRASQRIKHQRFGRKLDMIVGTMRVAGSMRLPARFVFGERRDAPFVLATVTIDDILQLYRFSTDSPSSTPVQWRRTPELATTS